MRATGEVSTPGKGAIWQDSASVGNGGNTLEMAPPDGLRIPKSTPLPGPMAVVIPMNDLPGFFFFFFFVPFLPLLRMCPER